MPAGVHFPYADTQFVIPVSFRGADPHRSVDKTLTFRLFGTTRRWCCTGSGPGGATPTDPDPSPAFPWRMPDIWATRHGCRAAFAVRDGRYAASSFATLRRRWSHSAHRLRQRCESDAGPRHGPRTRDRDSRRAGRIREEAHSATAFGKHRAGFDRRARRVSGSLC